MKRRILYLISDLNDSVIFEWIFTDLRDRGLEMHVILINGKGTVLESSFTRLGFNCISIPCRGKKDYLSTCMKIIPLIRKIKPDAVHCHLLKASLLGLLAAKLTGVKKRIYTRHHSSEHHVYNKSGIKIDQLCNRLATKIIAISPVVHQILEEWEKVPAQKIIDIPHGFRLEQFSQISDERREGIREKYGLQSSKPVIGVISRLVHWKGVQYIIPAFKSLLADYPGAVLMLLNAQGHYEKEILHLLEAIPEKNKRIIKYESDVAAVYRLMDVFVHVPNNEHSEAFGQIYIEALAAGVPSVFTISGIAKGLIRDEFNALVVNYEQPAEIEKAIRRILSDENLRERLKSNGKESVGDFNFQKLLLSLETLYSSN